MSRCTDDASSLPVVTIAIPCFNEERHIEACLEDVFAQDYPAARIEVLIGDGMSTDRTREILHRIATRLPGTVRVIDNPHKLQAAAMNAMVTEARGEIIIRMDVHARYATDYVRQCVATLEETGAANVGGAQRARPLTWFQRALCAAVGGARYRDADAEGYVDTVFLGAFRKRVLEAAGGYDPMAITNEDAELNQRILAGGGRIYLSKKIVVHYFPRDSFRGLSRQYFRYGQGRARTLLKHKTFPTPRPAIPFSMVTAGAALLLNPSWRRLAPLAFGAYGALVTMEALRVSRRHGWTLAPAVAAIFPVLHLSHGVGFGIGLVQYAIKPDWGDQALATGGGART